MYQRVKARESGFQSYQNQILKLPLSPEVTLGKQIFRKRGRKVPACLTVIRTLSRGLEKEPLVLEIFLGGRGVRERMGLVILADEVVDNGAGFPEDDASVRVFDG